MLKESILLVASTGVLIYLIAPSNAPPKPEPAKVEAPKAVKPLMQPSDDGWDYDDGDSEVGDEEFTFGEPMTFVDGGNEQASPDQSPSNGQGQSGSSGSFASSGNAPSRGNRRPGAPGSLQNPIVMNPGGGTGSTDR
ncbi:MAG: hypothetical protein GW808_14940 [Sphingomonadales bacterium]|nr:hypothetical protein [Sphingomonadales bacterium]NCO49156.1 hypothetical protein [Sphingomonadales bacterium]NCP00072.1 hypothetical protein [Sphingomonadales bacterium]NCP27347.1 hypothetical protein [Sphingomonadales bacterium]NCP42555.1 hypothetical protein [Sphingomonadales bacterium]